MTSITDVKALEAVIFGTGLRDVINLADAIPGAISVVAIIHPDMLGVERMGFDSGSHRRVLAELMVHR